MVQDIVITVQNLLEEIACFGERIEEVCGVVTPSFKLLKFVICNGYLEKN